MAAQHVKPQSGRLATHEDLELIMDQQAWLEATSPENLGCSDAWDTGVTNRAFAFNNEGCVEMTHQSNRWVSGSDPIFGIESFASFAHNIPFDAQFITQSPQSQDLSLNGRGLYVYISKGPYKIMELSDPVISKHDIDNVSEVNDQDTSKHYTYTYHREDSQTTSLTVSQTTGLKVESKFELGGFSFGVEASFDTTNTKENTQTSNSSRTVTESTTIKPRTKFHYHIWSETTTTNTLYGLDFSIGSEVAKDGTVTGGIAKATQANQLNNWDRMFPIEDIKARGFLGVGVPLNLVQTAKYRVSNQNVVTKIETTDSPLKGH